MILTELCPEKSKFPRVVETAEDSTGSSNESEGDDMDCSEESSDENWDDIEDVEDDEEKGQKIIILKEKTIKKDTKEKDNSKLDTDNETSDDEDEVQDDEYSADAESDYSDEEEKSSLGLISVMNQILKTQKNVKGENVILSKAKKDSSIKIQQSKRKNEDEGFEVVEDGKIKKIKPETTNNDKNESKTRPLTEREKYLKVRNFCFFYYIF